MRSCLRQAFAREDYLCGFFAHFDLCYVGVNGSLTASRAVREATLKGAVAAPLAAELLPDIALVAVITPCALLLVLAML